MIYVGSVFCLHKIWREIMELKLCKIIMIKILILLYVKAMVCFYVRNATKCIEVVFTRLYKNIDYGIFLRHYFVILNLLLEMMVSCLCGKNSINILTLVNIRPVCNWMAADKWLWTNNPTRILHLWNMYGPFFAVLKLWRVMMKLKFWTKDSLRTLVVIHVVAVFCRPKHVAGNDGAGIVGRRFDKNIGCAIRNYHLLPPN